MGKGSGRRPGKGYDDNYDRIFKKSVAVAPSAGQLELPLRPAPRNGVTCRGSYLLGSACGDCERCDAERALVARAGLQAPR